MHDPALMQAAPHEAAGRLQQALAIVRRALDKSPGNYELADKAADLLVKLNLHDQAIFLAERGARVTSREPRFMMLAGDTQMRRQRYAEAAQYFEKAYAMNPSDLEPMRAYCIATFFAGNQDLAFSTARRHYEQRKSDIRAVALYSGMCELVGDLTEEVRALSEFLRAEPANPSPLQAILLPLARVHGLDPIVVLQHHVRLGELLAEMIPRNRRPHTNVPDPDRPLRIGYSSQDFRNRSAGHFIEPIITHHDKTQFKVTLYHNTISEDELTARLRRHAERYVDVLGLNDQQMAERIRADGIDILVDLSGHTGMGRIVPLVAKPAPIQYTYMGYPNTTGIRAIDYRIVDWHTDPAGSDHLATESLVRMEGCFLCYSPPPHASDPAPAPSLENKFVTFGSFNTTTKVSNHVLDVWAEVLKAVPGSRLLLKAMSFDVPATQNRIWNHLASRGIAKERVTMIGETKGKDEHMAMYAKLDIALDPWPYNGTTTTVEAMYMGVPVVGITGQSHVQRVGVSLLTNIGVPELIAKDEADYVRICAALAADEPRRIEMRSTLRSMVTGSVLCDHAGFTRRLESHYRAAWRDWCQRKRANPAL